jgi:subtilisin family serine protease
VQPWPADIAAASGYEPERRFLYVRGDVIVPEGDLDRQEVQDALGDGYVQITGVEGLVLARGVGNTPVVIRALRGLDVDANYNHVFLGGAPPFQVGASPNYLGGAESFALPADPPPPPLLVASPANGREVTVAVLDTGIMPVPFTLPSMTHVSHYDPPGTGRSGMNSGLGDSDPPDQDSDHYLERANGHGTFVTGIIHRLAPKAQVHIDKVLDTFGAGNDYEISLGLKDLANRLGRPHPNIVNCSFAGYTEDNKAPPALKLTLGPYLAAGVVVVAAAGNEGSTRKAYPAALPGVSGVAALEHGHRASWSNHGKWVPLCAPGADVVSTFYSWCGKRPPDILGDPDDFGGWAIASGTSFACPYVVGAIAATQRRWNRTAADALTSLMNDPTAQTIGNMILVPPVATV